MSVFNPEEFLNQVIPDVLETKYVNPDDGEYQMFIGDEDRDIALRSVKDGGIALDIYFEIHDEAVRQRLNRNKVKVRSKGIFLELDSNGKLLTGVNRNVFLGKIREAVGQNVPGKKIRDLKGAGPLLGTVRSRRDPNDETKIYVEVVDVAPVKSTGAFGKKSAA